MEALMRRERAAHSEGGFTVVELAITIVIMGMVIAPLCMVLVETLNTIPQAGHEVQHSTDSSHLEVAFDDAVTQAQGLSIYGGGAFNAQTVVFYEVGPSNWHPGSNLTKSNFNCGSGTVNLKMFDAWWSTGASPINVGGANDGGVPQPANGVETGATSPALDGSTNAAGTQVTMERYQMQETAIPNAGSGYETVQIVRYVSTDGGATFTSAGPYMTGYCNPGDTQIAILAYTVSTDGGHTQGALSLTLNLRAAPAGAQKFKSIMSGTARPSGSI